MVILLTADPTTVQIENVFDDTLHRFNSKLSFTVDLLMFWFLHKSDLIFCDAAIYPCFAGSK